jgi:hypothetical protein
VHHQARSGLVKLDKETVLDEFAEVFNRPIGLPSDCSNNQATRVKRFKVQRAGADVLNQFEYILVFFFTAT